MMSCKYTCFRDRSDTNHIKDPPFERQTYLLKDSSEDYVHNTPNKLTEHSSITDVVAYTIGSLQSHSVTLFASNSNMGARNGNCANEKTSSMKDNSAKEKLSSMNDNFLSLSLSLSLSPPLSLSLWMGKVLYMMH